MLRIFATLLAGLLLCGQTPMLPGFPPGTFQNRAALDAGGGLPGPPSFTYQGNFGTAGSVQTQTTNTLTIGGSGPQLVLLAITNNPSGQVIKPLSSPTISTGGTCLPYAEEQVAGGGVYSTFLACVTSGTGTATVTWTYADIPFAGSQIQVWTAPTSGLVSNAPTGGNGVTATVSSNTTVSTASTLNAATGGVCFVSSSNSVSSATTTDFSGGTFAPNTQVSGAANGNSFAAGDTIGNSVTNTTTANGNAVWGLPGNLSLSAVCFR